MYKGFEKLKDLKISLKFEINTIKSQELVFKEQDENYYRLFSDS